MNRQNKNKENRKIGLVLAVLALLMLAGIANAETYKIFIDSDYGFYRVIMPSNGPNPVSPVYENRTLFINLGDTVIFESNAEELLTIISEQGLWNNAILRWSYQTFSYTFSGSGTYGFYIKEYPVQHLNIIVGPQIEYILPTPNSVSWSNDYTKDKRDQFEVPIGTTVRFNITTDYNIYNVEFDPFRTIGYSDTKNVYGLYTFNEIGHGVYSVYIYGISSDGTKTGKQWDVYVYSPTPTPQTATPTPIATVSPTQTIIPTVTVPQNRIHNIHIGSGTVNLNCDICHGFPPIFPTKVDEQGNTICNTCHPKGAITPIVTPNTQTATPTITTTPTDTSPGHPDEYWERMREQYPPNKRATLEVTNKIDRSGNEAVITINMKNIGNDTAKFVNFSSSIPSELGSTLISGAEWNGNELIWKGDINAGEEHNIIYKVKPVKIDIEIPTKITYVKDSITTNKIMSKAATEGIRSESILDSIDPQDLQTILLVIQITKAVLPGFEAIFGLSGILAIYMVMRKRK